LVIAGISMAKTEKKHGRKAIAATTLITLIIGLVGFVVLLAFTGQFLLKMNEAVHDKTCQYSVILHDASEQLVDFSCPRKEITIGTDSVIAGGGKKRVMVGTKITKSYKPEYFEEAAKYTISDEMFRCWDIFGRGDLDIMKRNVVSGNNYCIVCADITFSKDARQTNTQPITGLDSYMSGHKITQLGINQTYTDFLSSQQYQKKSYLGWTPIYTLKSFSSFDPAPDQAINTKDDYVVAFVGYRKSYLRQIFNGVSAATPQSAVMNAFFPQYDKEGVYSVNLYKADEITDANCDYLYN
jgi:hypothetical protein